MKTKIYALKDTVIGEFVDLPIYTKNDGTAIRYCTDLIAENQIRNARDKQLYLLGEYNTETGEITSEVKFICNLADFVNKGGADA